MIDPALYGQALHRVAATGFTAAIQTKIALVLLAAKNGNLAYHASLQWMPGLGVARPFIISQVSREQEAIHLLASTTQWANQPALAVEASRITMPLMLAWSQIMMPPGPLFNQQVAYRGLALGHAQLARLRLTPVIPDDVDLGNPFVVALQRIDQENARMIQTQIRMLKGLGTDIAIDDREKLVEKEQQLVDGVASEFLSWLARA
jgi:hypothetical protein